MKKVQHAKDVAFNFEQGCYKLHAWLCLSLLEDHPLYNINTFDAFEHLPFLMKLEVCLKFSCNEIHAIKFHAINFMQVSIWLFHKETLIKTIIYGMKHSFTLNFLELGKYTCVLIRLFCMFTLIERM